MLPAAGPAAEQQANAFDDLLDCSICYTPFQRPLQLTCGHSFCTNCVDQMCAHERNEPDYFGNFEHLAQLAGRDLDFLYPQIYARERDLVAPAPGAAFAAAGLGGAQEAEGAVPRGDNDDHRYARYPAYELQMRRARVPRAAGARHIDIKCPECRRTTRVPPEGLPVNYRLQDMIARLNINKNKTAKRDLLKCETCTSSLNDGSFFMCKSEECTQQKDRLCPMCAIRHHNGHPIDEVKILGEKDITEAKEAINMHTARAHEAVEQIEAGFGEMATKGKETLAAVVKNGMKTFETIVRGLDNQVFTSVDSLAVSIDQAKTIADQYEIMTNTIREYVAQADSKFSEIAVELMTFFRNSGFSAEEIKREPEDADPVVIEDPERRAAAAPAAFQQQDLQNILQLQQQQQQFRLMVQQAQRDERDRDLRRDARARPLYQPRELMRHRAREGNLQRANEHREMARRARAFPPAFGPRRFDEDMPEEPLPPAVVFAPVAIPGRRRDVAIPLPAPPVEHPEVRIIPLNRQDENPGPRDPRAVSPLRRRAQTPMRIIKEEPRSAPGSPGPIELDDGPPVARRTRRAARRSGMNPNAAGPSNANNNNNNNNAPASEEEPNTGAQQHRTERRRRSPC